MLNERLREVENELLDKLEKITKHLLHAIKYEGMSEYKTFVAMGRIFIQTEDGNIPDDVYDRLNDMPSYMITVTNESFNSKDYEEFKDYIRHYDLYYFRHPEGYPDNYSPDTKTWDRMIMGAIIDHYITMDDLMYLKPEDIMSYIDIKI